MKYLFKKLGQKQTWKKIFLDRLTEPLHLNFLSLFVLLFGNYRQKVFFDLVVRPQYAFGILAGAQAAKNLGFKKVTLIEFGVGSGAGLMNMIELARKTKRATGIDFQIVGFDTGAGMPKAKDFRDHPDLYSEGDFPMDWGKLSKALQGEAQIFIGEIKDSLEKFIAALTPSAPIGFVALDVDYYSSAVDALNLFKAPAPYFLPTTHIHVDDIQLEPHNSLCGELLAIKEFNAGQNQRIIEHHIFFENRRIFRNATWLKHIYQLHLLDHPARIASVPQKTRRLENPYL